MDIFLHEFTQGGVDHAVTLDTPVACEGGGDDAYLEMSAPVLRARMAAMGSAVVLHLQLQRCEALLEAGADEGSAVGVHGRVLRNGLMTTRA